MTAQSEYQIADPRPIMAAAPYTFFLPSAVELGAVQQGDLVKLLFEYNHEVEEWAAERMWVKVIHINGDAFSGTLENEPFEPLSTVKLGSSIAFERHHILDIVWADPAAAPQSAECREYWERCLVDACVLGGEEPVEYIYREKPDMAAPDDKYPDSGWRIRGRVGDATDEEVDARKAEYVALGAVLNKDDSWLHLIDAAIGKAYLRDFATGSFVEQNGS